MHKKIKENFEISNGWADIKVKFISANNILALPSRFIFCLHMEL